MTHLIGSSLPPALIARLRQAGDLVGVVATQAAGRPDAAPVSLIHVASASRLLLGLAHDRRTLAGIRAGSRVAVSLVLVPDVAVTVSGAARVVVEAMAASDHVAAVAVAVDEVKDDRHAAVEIVERLRHRWTDPERGAVDAALLAELRRL